MIIVCSNLSFLGLHDSYGAKYTEKPTVLVHFAILFYNQAIFQKSEGSFIDQVAMDGKCIDVWKALPGHWWHSWKVKVKFVARSGRY